MRNLLARLLDGLDLPVVMIDGTGLGGHLIRAALRIDREGRKHAPGARDGTKEGAEVCASLLRVMVGRGLPVARERLFVIGGSTGIRKAIAPSSASGRWFGAARGTSGGNVLEHLPESRRPLMRAAVNRAWAGSDAAAARRSLLRLADQLKEASPSEAGTLREALEETVTSLGLSGALRRTL